MQTTTVFHIGRINLQTVTIQCGAYLYPIGKAH
ncbi:Uncharacterised protein [Vibrio cholerae]|nr:Uncharacterised protein [Vibrio cholerae]